MKHAKGIISAIALVGAVGLAIVGTLYVLELMTVEQLKEFTLRGVILLAIFAALAFVVSFIQSSGKD